MKKLTNEQMFNLVDKITAEMCPDENTDNIQKAMAKGILSMVATFMLEYQEEVEK